MQVTALELRNFRVYERQRVNLDARMVVVAGPNGAGKTNLLEAVYLACTGRSFRTSTEREAVRFGQGAARLVLHTRGSHADHVITVGFGAAEPGGKAEKRITVDGSPVERLFDIPMRPLVSVFAPDRLELILGPPSLRRAHMDQVVAALWPSRTGARVAYTAALGQRNALLARIRSGRSGRSQLPAWDAELARHGVEVMEQRRELVAKLAEPYAEHAAALGLPGIATVELRLRSEARDPDALARELADRVESDLERGFTGHGPHRDELRLTWQGRDLRTYGSRGQQRLGLLSLLLAERAVLTQARGVAPLMLLDDVMSELDAERRGRLFDVLLSGGQTIVSTTELEHVPGSDGPAVIRLHVHDGQIVEGDGAHGPYGADGADGADG